jgi:hypothetical protein
LNACSRFVRLLYYDTLEASYRIRVSFLDSAKLSRGQCTFSRMIESNTKEGVEVTELI